MTDKIYDYTEGNRSWGHDIIIHKKTDECRRLEVSGFGVGIEVGDFIGIGQADNAMAYRVDVIKYERDPADMFWATLQFVPGSEINAQDTIIIS